MNFDVNKTISLVKGCLLNHEATWNSYLGENPGWQQTAITLTGPMILANVILGVIFSRMTGGFGGMGIHSGFLVGLILTLILTAAGFVVAVFVVNFLAGTFEGKADFPRAFAAVSMASVPAWVAGIVGALIPWVGMLIFLAGSIVSLVFLYKIMPLALGVPDAKRVLHFVISVVIIIISNMILISVLGLNSMRGGFSSTDYVTGKSASGTPVSSGMFGELERQGRLMDAAAADVYDPPEDGMLTDDQVENYVSVMKKAQVAQENYSKEMQQLSEEMDKKQDDGETPSVADISKVYRGVGTAMGANNAEMEIVKTADGNWAEHQWVKEQLRVARLQLGQGSEELEHNYALYQEYADQLQGLE